RRPERWGRAAPRIVSVIPTSGEKDGREGDGSRFASLAAADQALRSSLQQQPEKRRLRMNALVVRVTIHNVDRTRELLNSQVVPQVSGAPGFKTGYWTWSTGGGVSNGLPVIIFYSAGACRAAGESGGGQGGGRGEAGWGGGPRGRRIGVGG